MIIRLDESTQCEELCKIIQKIINKHVKETGSPAKAIAINVVSDIIDIEPILPKLEYKDV